MSMYIYIYVRKDDEIIPLVDYNSRSTVYQYLDMFAPYERLKRLTRERLAAAIDNVYYDIEQVNKKIKLCEERINNALIAKSSMTNTCTFDEVMKYIEEQRSTIADLREELDNLVYAKATLQTYYGMTASIHCFNNGHEMLYCGCATGSEVTLSDIASGEEEMGDDL